MEIDANLASLFRTLTMGDPLTAPKSWESLPSEGGGGLFRPESRPFTNSGGQIRQPSTVTEYALVRLALNALQGTKASLVELEEISDAFCSIPADRTNQGINNLWCHGSSTSALGHFLRSIHATGLKVFFIQEFVDFYLYPSRSENEGKSVFSLVNQAFASAIRKLLEGYLCALNTLSASVGLRRSGNQNCCLDVTLLEVYLHTEELRRFVDSIGNICFVKRLGLDLGREDLSTETVMDFYKFFRGAELLSYLYMHLRDADHVHSGLLKYLFVRSFEPYWEFIKSWIYQAKLNDPYEEFFLVCSDGISVSNSFLTSEDELSQFVEERSDVPLPYFLGDVSGPILRTGEQLHVLVKLLSFCNFSFVERRSSSEGIFPCWFTATSGQNSSFLLNSLTSLEKSIEALVSKREALYKSLMEKLKDMHIKFDTSSKWTKHGFHHRFQDTHYSPADSMDTETDANIPVGAEYNEATSTSDDSLYGAQFEKASTCSSSDDSEEEHAALDVSISPPKHANACERLFSSQISSNLNDQTVQIEDPFKRNRMLEELHHDTGSISDSVIENNQKFSCWPLGYLLENPFVSNRNCVALEDMWSVVDEEEPVLSEGFETFLVMDNLHGVQSKGKLSFMSRNYNLSANPILTKAIWPSGEFGDENCVTKQGFLGPVFDFLSVKTPSGNFFEKSVSDSSLMKESSAVTCHIEVKHLVKPNVSRMKTEPKLCPSREAHMKESGKVDASGGAQWTGSLGYSSKDVECTGDADCWRCSDPACEMPLDLVMSKCIMQEILLQYRYVSNFTLKLLKEGFDLDDHFLALRRYHFMEMADWADYLVGSLFNQTRSHIQAEHNIAEVQGLLDLALQRSSCESDPYRERLFVSVKEDDKLSFSGDVSGLSIFDCIMLGFRVDWPVTIVITQEALKIYAEIFGWLGQIRFSLFSLTHTWNFVKGFVKANKSPGAMKELNAFLRVRQKVSHFVSTLLQYVHSQLSAVSWCSFQHSLKHQAKDMLELRSMHMSYLQEALHICFWSAETKPVAAIIRNILQCAIDLSSCVTRVSSNSDNLTLHSLVNFPEVSAINMRFESLLKDLHHLYMNSPKHGELSLCRLWGYLNYNNCYSFASFPF